MLPESFKIYFNDVLAWWQHDDTKTEQNWADGCFFYLYKEWNGVESSDDYSVVDVSGQDVKCSCAALHNLLHTNSLLITEKTQLVGFTLWEVL